MVLRSISLPCSRLIGGSSIVGSHHKSFMGSPSLIPRFASMRTIVSEWLSIAPVSQAILSYTFHTRKVNKATRKVKKAMTDVKATIKQSVMMLPPIKIITNATLTNLTSKLGEMGGQQAQFHFFCSLCWPCCSIDASPFSFTAQKIRLPSLNSRPRQ